MDYSKWTEEDFEKAKEQAWKMRCYMRCAVLDVIQRHPNWTEDDLRDYFEDL